MPLCNQDEFFVEPMKIKQGVALKKVSRTAEIPKEVDKLQEECKRVEINKLEVLPSMEDNHHHGIVILYDFENPFMRKESAREESFSFFMFVSPTNCMWAQCVPQGMLNSISIRTSEDLLHESKPMNYGSMMTVYGCVIEEY